uniref:Nicotinic acid receptor n=1 Tax=Osmerus mordax TaxID=8014 RepID=C1BLC8_OSMMO|nr:Nicotinic acid receptor [Osmerus mordax]
MATMAAVTAVINHSTRGDNISSNCNNTPNLLKVLPPVLIIEMLVGLPGNLIALWIFSCRLKVWRPNTLFLFNLVLADFLLLISVPFRIDNHFREENWVFGGTWCRVNLFMLAVNRSSSIAFMTAVAMDRYFKVVHPHHRINRMTSTQAKWVAVGIWMVVISLRIPLLATDLIYENQDKLVCRSFNPRNVPPSIKLHYMVFIGEFFFPLLLLLFCSARIACILHQRQMNRKKVRRAVRVVLVIVLVFVICFFPGIATGLAAMALKAVGADCATNHMAAQVFMLSIGFTYMNSALDPIIYCFSSSMFRNSLKSSLNCLGLVDMRLSRRGSVTSGG